MQPDGRELREGEAGSQGHPDQAQDLEGPWTSRDFEWETWGLCGGNFFSPGEIEAMIQDTVGYHVLWSQPSRHAGTEGLSEVRASIQRAEQDGIAEVVTGKAGIEYKWGLG